MAQGTMQKIPSVILTETKNVSFSSGVATISAKSGYYLVTIYANNRPSSESNNYSMDAMQRDTNGDYKVFASTSFTASVNMILVWCTTN